MKLLFLGVAGLLLGALATTPACFGCNVTAPVPAGRFVGVAAPYFDASVITEPDYVLEVVADRRSVTETYTREGRAYVVVYEVTNPEGSGGGAGSP